MAVNRVLVLRNSLTGPQSYSNQCADKAIDAVKKAYPSVVIVERDLVDQAVPGLTKETVQSIQMGVLETQNQKDSVALSNTLIEEIKSVDLIIIGFPRYNFGTPSSFKNYMDYVARPKITFQYGANGPEGMLPNTPVWGFVCSGAIYGDDYYHQWVKTILGFVGLKTVTLFNVEGTAMGKGAEALANLDLSKVVGELSQKQ